MNHKRAGKAGGTSPARPVTGRLLRFKGAAALQLYLGSSPLFLLPGAYLLPNHPLPALLLPIAAVLLTFMAGLLPGKYRRPGFLLSLLLQAALCAAVLPQENPLSYFLYLPCLVLMLFFMKAMAQPSGLEWPASVLAAGVLTHLAGQALKNQAIFASAGGMMSLFFSGYLLLCLFTFNRYALLGTTGEAQFPPARLLSKNRRLLLIIGLTALPAANWQMVKDAAQAAWLWLKSAFFALLLLLSYLFPTLTPVKEGAAPRGFAFGAPEDAAPPSAFAQLMETVLTILAVIIASLLLLYALYQLSRLLKRAMSALLARLREYSRAIGEGYEDKTESLLHWGDVGRAAKDKWELFQKRRRRLPAWERLTAREKVRRVYALLLKRMRQDAPSLTAREALQSGQLSVPPKEAEQMALLYEAARYSEHPVSPGDAEAMRKSAGV